MTDLSALFEAFLAGNNSAFAELYHDINPRLSAYCHKLVGSRAGSAAPRADDLMQELWERVIAMRSPAFNKKKLEIINPTAFLFRMLKNLAIDHYRSRAFQGALVSLEDSPYPEGYGYESHDDVPSDIEALILDSLEKLPKEDHEVLVLNIYSGYSFGEIAEMLGKSSDAIWQQASRARVKLRKIVIEDAQRMGVALPSMNGNSNIAAKKEAKI